MRAFIVRPFGTKPDKQGNAIDFEAVERDLICPALQRLGIEGRTTMEIAAAGNIREDMFRLLIAADIVIADISIHNANVFYELGIRHALRPRRTFMIRCRADEGIFDLATDRYLEYPRDRPADGVPALVTGLRQTVDDERTDSPVFLLLPDLPAQSFDRLLPVPIDFQEEVGRAAREGEVGDLRLLAAEARGFAWEGVGLRLVGRAQFAREAFPGARRSWEAVRDVAGEDDLEANTLLATIYQRLGELVRSDQAVARALGNKLAAVGKRAELLALTASNAKRRWQLDWSDLPAADRQGAALRSPRLDDAITAYGDGYAADRNHFYSGLNALALLTTANALAAAAPDAWADRFASDTDAAAELDLRQRRCEQLAAAVSLSLDSARQSGRKDEWADISAADLRLLTAQRPAYVASAYRQAIAGASNQAIASARQQLELYRRLGIFTEAVDASLAAFPPVAPPAAAAAEPRALLFTGHMVDAPGRRQPRFPAAQEAVARAAIAAAVAAELALPGEVAGGIAGGANGGDLLFHEVCAELGVATRLYLALPREPFIASSVAPGGPAWVERFQQTYTRQQNVRVLAGSEELPRWLRGKPEYGIWQRNMAWELHNALALGSGRLTLIALWDGQTGDGPGGTADLVAQARAAGAKVVILNTSELFGL